MAHVHGEYLEMEEEDENNVELEMVVEEEAPNPEIEVILPDVITDEIKEKSKELETGKTPRHLEFKAVDKKSAEKLLVSGICEGYMYFRVNSSSSSSVFLIFCLINISVINITEYMFRFD